MNALPDIECVHIRQAYNAFEAGARLHSDNVLRLLATKGIRLTNNAARNLGRYSDRGSSISAAELAALISAWAEKQRGPWP